MTTDETPYLFRGMKAITTESAVLVSSSRYLNNPALRDWVSTAFLRRSSKAQPTPADMPVVGQIVLDTQDLDAIEEMITRDRQRFPELDAWFSAGFVSTFGKDDLTKYAPGSVGRIFHDYLVDRGFEIDIMPRFEPKSQCQYFLLRSAQTHDFEHIVCGGSFDTIGELVPYYMRLANMAKFLSPDLAGELNVTMALGCTRIFLRTAIHYHQAFPAALQAIKRGITVGEQSGPLFMAKYEDVFHLPLEEGRRALGVVGAVDVDTSEASRAWEENQ